MSAPIDPASTAMDTLAALAALAKPACGPVTVIAIDGRAGSGKSTLGDRLAALLDCPLVHMEDLYPGWHGLEQGIDLLNDAVLNPLAAGRAALIPAWDWHAGGWGQEQRLEPVPLLVVEGVGSAAARVASHISLIAWLECDEPTRRARALARAHDGEAFAPEWASWATQEDALLARDRTGERADIVIDTSGEASEHRSQRGPARA